MATGEELYGTAGLRAASALRPLFALVALAGGGLALTGSALAAVLILAGVGGMLAAQLAVGVLGYRRAMRASWPEVPPVREDDWE